MRFSFALVLLAGTPLVFGQQPQWKKEAKVAPVSVGQAKNSSAFGTQVYFAGQPEQADFQRYAKLGVKTVINLRQPSEMETVGFDEPATVKADGMNYLSVPMSAAIPDDAALKKIFSILDKAGDEKVLLHCASSSRVGFAWALYRGSGQGLSADEAIAEGKAAGMKSPVFEKLAREKLQPAR